MNTKVSTHNDIGEADTVNFDPTRKDHRAWFLRHMIWAIVNKRTVFTGPTTDPVTLTFKTTRVKQD